VSGVSVPDDLIPYALEADASRLWPNFPHEWLKVGDTIELKRGGEVALVHVTRVIPGPGGQVMYETQPAGGGTPTEIEVTPENAQQLFTEGKITVNQVRKAHGLPPFEPAVDEAPHDGSARTPRIWDYPVGGPGCPGCNP
jgi:hypothetical protein